MLDEMSVAGSGTAVTENVPAFCDVKPLRAVEVVPRGGAMLEKPRAMAREPAVAIRAAIAGLSEVKVTASGGELALSVAPVPAFEPLKFPAPNDASRNRVPGTPTGFGPGVTAPQKMIVPVYVWLICPPELEAVLVLWKFTNCSKPDAVPAGPPIPARFARLTGMNPGSVDELVVKVVTPPDVAAVTVSVANCWVYCRIVVALADEARPSEARQAAARRCFLMVRFILTSG